MTIRSKYVLPSSFKGKGWTADLLSAPGKRAGMKCIYKIRMDGDTKRAGIYLQDSSDSLVKMNVAGNNFIYDLENNEVKYSALNTVKYTELADDAEFIKLVRLTLAHFGVLESEDGVYTPPPPKVTALTDEEAAQISGFGIF